LPVPSDLVILPLLLLHPATAGTFAALPVRHSNPTRHPLRRTTIPASLHSDTETGKTLAFGQDILDYQLVS